MTQIKNLFVKYGHTLVQGIVLAGQAYLLAANGGKLTAANYIGALAQLALAQHARQSEPAA
jgi:hypothetical protein